MDGSRMAEAESLRQFLNEVSSAPLADRRRGGRAREADRAGRPRGQGPHGQLEPAAGGLDRQALPGAARLAAGPDPGGHAGPDPRRREVRLAPRLQVLDLRDLVDPPGDRARIANKARTIRVPVHVLQRERKILRAEPDAGRRARSSADRRGGRAGGGAAGPAGPGGARRGARGHEPRQAGGRGRGHLARRLLRRARMRSRTARSRRMQRERERARRAVAELPDRERDRGGASLRPHDGSAARSRWSRSCAALGLSRVEVRQIEHKRARAPRAAGARWKRSATSPEADVPLAAR